MARRGAAQNTRVHDSVHLPQGHAGDAGCLVGRQSPDAGYTVLCAAPDLATAFIEGECHYVGGDDEVLKVEQL